MARKKLDPSEKYDRRQEQNRQAQARCRQKKMDTIHRLEMQLNKLQYFINTHCDPVVFKKWMAENTRDVPVRRRESFEQPPSVCKPAPVTMDCNISNSDGNCLDSKLRSLKLTGTSESFDSQHSDCDDYQPQSDVQYSQPSSVIQPPLVPAVPPALALPQEATIQFYLNALSSPRDLASYAPSECPVIQTSQPLSQQPLVHITPMLTPGHMFVGSYPLGILLTRQCTTFTPTDPEAKTILHLDSYCERKKTEH